jgi:predicted porin
MKKSLIALAALAAVGVASAQSSVSISGQVDVGLVNPIGAQKMRIDQSANGANQIVFSGTEDLGGGLRATFRLAQRFSPESGADDGTAGNRVSFQGETTVGLAGGFGALRIGRAVTAFQAPINNTDPWGTLQQASLAVLTTGYATAADFANVTGAASGSGAGRSDGIFYTSPTFSGFTASVTYGPKDSQLTGATTTGAKNLTSAWLAYNQGPIMAGAGMEENRSGDKIQAVQGSYNLGVARIGATWASTNFAATTVDRKSYNVSVIAPMGAITLKAGVGQSKLENAAASVKKTGVGVDYALSKRTMIYTSMGRDTGTGTAVSKTGFDLGVRHAF